MFNFSDSDVKYARLGALHIIPHPEDSDPQLIAVRKIHKHPEYMPSLYYHDIALLELEAPAKLTQRVNFTRLDPTFSLKDDVNHTAVVAGWGKISFFGPRSPHALKAYVTVFDSSFCKTALDASRTRKFKNGFDKVTQICAVGTAGRDTCVVG